MRTKADLKRARSLYDIERYTECMDVVDLILGIPREANFGEVSDALQRDWFVELKPGQFTNAYTSQIANGFEITLEDNDVADMRSFGAPGLVDVLTLRALCLSAIFFSSDTDAKSYRQDDVMLNAFLLLKLIPLDMLGAPDLWRFAAQSLLLFQGHTAQALGMMVDAVRALQQERPKELALGIKVDRDFLPERELLKTTIPRVVEALQCGDDVKMLVRELESLVSAPEAEPPGRGWRSWFSARR